MELYEKFHEDLSLRKVNTRILCNLSYYKMMDLYNSPLPK